MAQHRSRRRQVRRWVDIALLVAFIAFVAAGLAAIASGRYQVRPVLSGSMQPGLPIGGVVITERVPVSGLQVRDVVVFHRPGQPTELVVHRIISLTPGPSGPIIQTQGDANTVPDPWKVSLRGPTAYRAVFSLPLLGYGAAWAHGPNGRVTLMSIGLLLVAGAAAGSLVQLRRKNTTKAGPVVEPADDGASPVASSAALRTRL